MFHLAAWFLHGIFHVVFGLLWIVIVIALLIDIAASPNLSCLQKLVWGLVVFFMPCVGGLLYLLLGRRRSTI